ncbi:MFS transporter [Kitasatospora sp. NPDC085879]|uniref:MFS transporter n=1 Tax=Kitasatospora sp. NPDC085879 TaxID=3154769 RepID=UPI003443021C
MTPRPHRKYLILAVLSAGSSMTMLDTVTVAVALPSIGAQLHTGLTGLQWVVEAYSLAYAALLLAGAALGNRFGSKKVFLAGLAFHGRIRLLRTYARP